MEVYLTDEAKEDLAAAWDHLLHESGSRAAGERLLDDLERVFDLLSRHPEAGHPRPELQPGVRSFPQGRYTVFYRFDARAVDVLRVLHQRRDIDAVF